VWFRTSDNVNLHAWWLEQTVTPLATLFLHGNAGNVTHRAAHAEAITEAGSSLLLLDYRGYGKSAGHPSERGLYRDATAAYQELLRRGFSSSQIILHGESLGTAVAVELATKVPCAALILESPLSSLAQMAATVVPVLGPLLARGYDSLTKIESVMAPLLIIHGGRDEIVPFSQGEALFQRAKEPKRFWAVPEGHHNDLLDVAGSEYIDQLKSFYNSLTRS
jgi:fermentation-respiration switch protein FrsA (DUF1100 family)